MNRPPVLLTVIVPSYNMEAYLPKCLKSLLVPDESLLRRLEVIVVNDGSTDRTSAIAHQFERDYPGIFRVIDKGNGNYGSCVNAALPEANGLFVRILDADDSADTRGFSSLLQAMADEESKGDDSAELIVSDYVLVDPDGRVLSRVGYSFKGASPHSLQDVPERTPRFMLHAVTYKRAILERIGYRQTEGISYTDTEWTLEPMVGVSRILHVPVVATRYLVGRAGQTCEPATFIRTFGVFAQIAQGLASRYELRESQSVPEAVAYYRSRLLDLFFYVFEGAIYGLRRADSIQRHPVSVDLKTLDAEIRKSRSLFELTEQARYPSSHFPVRLIRAWRRHPGSGTPAIVAFWFFIRLRYMAQRLRRFLRRGNSLPRKSQPTPGFGPNGQPEKRA